MNALLIGGIGYVGGRVAAHLKSQGHHVAVTTRRPATKTPSWLQADEIISRPDFQFSSDVFKDRDVIIHLAAPDEIAAERNPFEALNAGADVTWATLQSLVASGHASIPFIYLSTFHVYGKNARGEMTEATVPYPVHPYGLGRYLGECVVRAFRERHKVNALCVRMSNSFGAAAGFDVPRWTLIFNDLCLQAVKTNEMVLKSAGLQERNFITLEDAARALEFLAQRPTQWPQDGILHLGSDLQLNMLKVTEFIAEGCRELLVKSPSIVRPEPKPGERTVAFDFQSKRLAALGFTWKNDIRNEVRATLELCRRNLALTSPSTSAH